MLNIENVIIPHTRLIIDYAEWFIYGFMMCCTYECLSCTVKNLEDDFV